MDESVYLTDLDKKIKSLTNSLAGESFDMSLVNYSILVRQSGIKAYLRAIALEVAKIRADKVEQDLETIVEEIEDEVKRYNKEEQVNLLKTLENQLDK